MFSLFAFTLSAVALWLLYLSWRQPATKPLLIVVAWLMMLASLPLWTVNNGVIFGICFALITISLQAWILIAVTQRKKTAKPTRIPKRQAINWRAGVTALPQQLGLFLMAVPLAGLTAMLLTTVVTGWLNWSAVDLMALGIYTMPLVWGILSYWTIADRIWWRPAAVLLVTSALCSWSIYL